VDDPVAWLRQQLDEDERVAKNAARRSNLRPGHKGQSARWRSYEEGGSDGYAVESESGDTGFIVGKRGTAEHIARHDPARVLREVEAKRRIVDSFAAGMEAEPLRRGTEGYAIVRMVLRLLTLPYSDRPGYRDEWKP
jgi:hypothetical protein